MTPKRKARGAPDRPPPRSNLETSRALCTLVSVSLFVAASAPGAGAIEPVRKLARADIRSAVEITYIGNEGFLIANRGGKILIDALYRDGVAGYAVVSPERRTEIENARGAFADIDLVLATHHHADHFDPRSVAAHLSRNPAARFVSTEQAVAQLRSSVDGFDGLRDRITGLFPREGEPLRISQGEIELSVLNLHHGRDRPVQNLGFLMTLGGKKLLHVGDTAATALDLGLYGLGDEQIDIALLPFWYLVREEWQSAVRDEIRPKRIIVMHLPSTGSASPLVEELGGIEKMLSRIKQDFPNTTIFRREGETAAFR